MHAHFFPFSFLELSHLIFLSLTCTFCLTILRPSLNNNGKDIQILNKCYLSMWVSLPWILYNNLTFWNECCKLKEIYAALDLWRALILWGLQVPELPEDSTVFIVTGKEVYNRAWGRCKFWISEINFRKNFSPSLFSPLPGRTLGNWFFR